MLLVTQQEVDFSILVSRHSVLARHYFLAFASIPTRTCGDTHGLYEKRARLEEMPNPPDFVEFATVVEN